MLSAAQPSQINSWILVKGPVLFIQYFTTHRWLKWTCTQVYAFRFRTFSEETMKTGLGKGLLRWKLPEEGSSKIPWRSLMDLLFCSIERTSFFTIQAVGECIYHICITYFTSHLWNHPTFKHMTRSLLLFFPTSIIVNWDLQNPSSLLLLFPPVLLTKEFYDWKKQRDRRWTKHRRASNANHIYVDRSFRVPGESAGRKLPTSVCYVT
jgi:hypothetical protein